MSDYRTITQCALVYADAYAAALESVHQVARHDAVLAARLELVECLLKAGWTPSPEVAKAVERDRAVLRTRASYWDHPPRTDKSVATA